MKLVQRRTDAPRVMMNARRLAVAAMMLVAACSSREDVQPSEVAGSLVAGQIWTYKTRPGEEGSRLTILKTESHPKLGNIIHVAVDGVRLQNPRAPGGASTAIGHMPYQESALRASLVAVSGQASS